MISVFQDALSGTKVSGRSTETFSIPYLLQLCSSSVALLDVLMDSVLPKGIFDVIFTVF